MDRFMLSRFFTLSLIKVSSEIRFAPSQKHWRRIARSLRREENFLGVRILHFSPTRKTTHINVPSVRRKRTRDKAGFVRNWNSVRSVAFSTFCFRRRRSSPYQWFRWGRAWARTGSNGCVALDIVFMGRAPRGRFLLGMRDRVAQRLQ